MTGHFRNPLAVLAVFALALGGCATTQLNSVWKDPAYQNRPARIMVVGVFRSPLYRRVFEDEFVTQLQARGTAAIASYTVLPDMRQDDRNEIAAKVKELGADAILITRLVSKKTVQTYVPATTYFPPPYYNSWPDYYGYGYRYMYSPGYIAENEYAVMETNLYQAGSDKLIWAASAETGLGDTTQAISESYIKVMVNNMLKLGLLGK
jgi:hypothetical protein